MPALQPRVIELQPPPRRAAARAELALCRAIEPAADGTPPEWLLLAPAGEILGRDGRRFRNPDPAVVVAQCQAGGADIPLDWEHATHIRAPQGLDAPAAGWVVEVQARGAEVWGRVEWTEAGAAAVRERGYRYYSPAYYLDPQTRAITDIPSVGLTNRPNLALPALNSTEAPMFPESVLTALGLAPDADEAAVLAAIEALKAAPTMPNLNSYAPRAELDLALNRAVQAETALRTAQQAEINRQVDALIAQGLAAARITPATMDYHRAQAQTEGGIERLRSYLAAAPAVVTDASRAGKPPEGSPELNAEQRRIRAAFGHTPETLARYGASQ
jgi:phage I-like protein